MDDDVDGVTGDFEEERAENLLAALSVAVTGHLLADANAATQRPASDTAALIVLSTTLDGASQERLGSTLSLTQSGTVRLVNRLSLDGLVLRRAGPDDRTHSIVLTRKGRSAGRRALARRKRITRDLTNSLTPEQRAGLVAALEVMLAQLTTSGAEAFRICRLCDPDACGHKDGRCPVTQAVP